MLEKRKSCNIYPSSSNVEVGTLGSRDGCYWRTKFKRVIKGDASVEIFLAPGEDGAKEEFFM